MKVSLSVLFHVSYMLVAPLLHVSSSFQGLVWKSSPYFVVVKGKQRCWPCNVSENFQLIVVSASLDQSGRESVFSDREVTASQGNRLRDFHWWREWKMGNNTPNTVYQGLQRYTLFTPFCLEKFQRGSKTWVGFSRMILDRGEANAKAGIFGKWWEIPQGWSPSHLE